jgi:hypothetical protein
MGNLVSGVKLLAIPGNLMTFKIDLQTFHQKHSYLMSRVQHVVVLGDGT